MHPMSNNRHSAGSGGGPMSIPPSGAVWFQPPANFQHPQHPIPNQHDGFPMQGMMHSSPGPVRVQQMRPNIVPYPQPGGAPMQMRPQVQNQLHMNQNVSIPMSTSSIPAQQQPQYLPNGHQMMIRQQPPPQSVMPRSSTPGSSHGPVQQPPMGVSVVSQQIQRPAMISGSGSIIDKIRLDELTKQIDKSTLLEENVKDAMIGLADEFVDEVISKVCRLVQHRGNQRLEARDVELVLGMVCKMPFVPRANVQIFGHQPTQFPRVDEKPPTDAHKQRMMLVKKHIKKL